ncbi:hypothetical protein [Microbacterium sp. Yaish 1]|uniref:hypothetical protein n=1 Tax=Microbacterium sp. Yaish 1 TaxID=2025014 RepID=UPI001C533BA0|nr:hypothetical protein [Microbacterium sp. Yaish 1]
MDTTPQPPPSGGGHSMVPNVLGLPLEAAPTALGLRMLAGTSPMRLRPESIAAQLYPTMSATAATELVILHVVMLEEAGHARTWADESGEWLVMLPLPSEAPTVPLTAPSAPGPAFAPRPAFSPAGESERERERARARARERARARADAEAQEWATRWASQGPAQPVLSRPARPDLLNAPPIGCHEHPNGTTTVPCGPCGTAAAYRRQWLANRRYMEQLAIFEEQQETPDDLPF